MIFKCKNCGGNTVFDPESGRMKCPHCDSFDSHQEIDDIGLVNCRNCGAEIQLKDFTSATKCEHCGTYFISDERISGDKKPSLLIPFKIDKKKATEILKEKLGDRIFVPSSFLSTRTLEDLQGYYVPFWLYDMYTRANYSAIGVKVRKWTSGDTEYTETSKYRVVRNMEINYKKIPVDASIEMDDKIMDEVEPYDYSALEGFDPKFLSGFYSEVYNQDARSLEERGRNKSDKFTNEWIQSTISGYTRMEDVHKDIDTINVNNQCALFPIWVYTYRYGGENYKFYVNGQSGESIGKVPNSKGKIIGFSILTFLVVYILVISIVRLVGVL